MGNIRHTECSLVWSFEAVGRHLLYYPALASGPLRLNDVIASELSFIPLDTDRVSTPCPEMGEGANLLVGGRVGQIM